MRYACPRVITANRGDLLSRQGILQALRDRGADDIVVFCQTKEHVDGLDCSTVPYGPLHNLIPTWRGFLALWRADTVLWTGGLDLQDDSSLIKLLHTWLVFMSYRLLGLRIVAVMQGAGPLTTRLGRWLTRHILNRASVFMARDPATFDLITSLGSRCRLILSHDGIFAGNPLAPPLSPADETRVGALTGDCKERPVIGFNLRMWFHFSSSLLPYQFAKNRYQERARARMTELVDAARQVVRELRRQHDARIVLFSMYEPGVEPWEDDLVQLRELKAGFANDAEVRVSEEPLGLRGFCELVRRCHLVVGMRLHATLTALRLGVPAIHLAYTLKGPDIYRALGLSDLVVDLEAFTASPALVANRIAATLNDAGLAERIRLAVAQAQSENTSALAQVFAEGKRS